MGKISIVVYGAEKICASCVGAPSSIDTYEWLIAALTRKYGENRFDFYYINIESEEVQQDALVQEIRKNDLFYPIVQVNGVTVGEGVIHLPNVTSVVDQLCKSEESSSFFE